MTQATRDKVADEQVKNHILELLSPEELARVSNAEGAYRLSDGDEYIDLEQLEAGVRQAPTSSTPMGRVLMKSAMHAGTWSKVLAQLSVFQAT